MPGIMAPWDALALFDLPTFTLVPVGTINPTRIVTANPRRVVLVMGSVSAATAVIIGPDNTVTSAKGLVMPSSSGPLSWLQQWHGPLAQCEWWAFAAAVTNVSIIEVILREWPSNGRSNGRKRSAR